MCIAPPGALRSSSKFPLPDRQQLSLGVVRRVTAHCSEGPPGGGLCSKCPNLTKKQLAGVVLGGAAVMGGLCCLMRRCRGRRGSNEDSQAAPAPVWDEASDGGASHESDAEPDEGCCASHRCCISLTVIVLSGVAFLLSPYCSKFLGSCQAAVVIDG